MNNPFRLRLIKRLLPVSTGLLLLLGIAQTAAAQTGVPTIDSPAAYRQAGLIGPEHARLVDELLRYELQNIKSLLANQLVLRPDGYSFTITNRATVAEVIGGTYTVTYYNAQDQALKTTNGRFGGLAPAASRNQSAKFPRPIVATRAELTVTAVEAE